MSIESIWAFYKSWSAYNLLPINDVTQGGRGVSQKKSLDDMGGGWGPEGPNIGWHHL